MQHQKDERVRVLWRFETIMFSQQIFVVCGIFFYYFKNTSKFLNYEAVFHSLLDRESDSASELVTKKVLWMHL